MAALTTAERLPEPEHVDYSVSHRPPPTVPSIPYSSVPERGSPDTTEPDGINNKRTRRRGGSFGQIFRLNSSSRSQSQQHIPLPSTPATGNTAVSPPIPPPTATPVVPPQQQHLQQPQRQHQSTPSPAQGRTSSFTGRNMLRKSSRKAREELERQEAERKARMNAPAPTLQLLHQSLPGIDSFGGETTNNISNTSSTTPAATTNFSRPSLTMPVANSSSPAYAVRAAPLASSSPDPGRANGNGEYVGDHVSRSESMTHRGRYSYASSVVSGNVSSPRRIRRRKDPTPFNILVIGAKNSGKTSFICLLRHALGPSSNTYAPTVPNSLPTPSQSAFTSHYLETEMDGERIGLTLWDSVGLERNIVDLQLREMSAFVESKFEETFAEEQKVVRSPGVKDTHIHCVLLVLDPGRLDSAVIASSNQTKNGVNLSSVGGLDNDLDLQVLRALWGKTTVIPVISKADTLTIAHMAFLKRAVWDSIKAARLDPLEALELEDDMLEVEEEDEDDDDDLDDTTNGHDEDTPVKPSVKSKRGSHKRHSSLSLSIKSSDDETPYIPMSILSPDPYDSTSTTTTTSKPRHPTKDHHPKIGRRFAWGFADPYNAEHCDFPRLRDSVFIEWRAELRDLSRSKWYENWRTSRLKNVPSLPSGAKQHHQQQRVRGGVTPVTAIPTSGLTSPGAAVSSFSGNSAVGGATPRAVSSSMAASPISKTAGAAIPLSKAERVMGIERNGAVQQQQGV